MLRFTFFSCLAEKKPGKTKKPLLSKAAPLEESTEMAALIADDIQAYLATQKTKATTRSRQDPKKPADELLSDFKRKNLLYLEKKQAFKAEPPLSAHYEVLRKEYLEATHSAYAAINLWSDYLKAQEEAFEEARLLEPTQFRMK
jgi:hypothetical protein